MRAAEWPPRVRRSGAHGRSALPSEPVIQTEPHHVHLLAVIGKNINCAARKVRTGEMEGFVAGAKVHEVVFNLGGPIPQESVFDPGADIFAQASSA